MTSPRRWFLLGFATLAWGCAFTIPARYQAQNESRYAGHADLGEFNYLPAAQQRLAANQIENTAIGPERSTSSPNGRER